MIAIIDYGVGNLFSLASSLNAIGQECVVTADAEALKAAERIILPGVGAFGDAAAKLRATGLVDTIRSEASAGKPLLGICLGMQMLFQKSYEYGEHEGLALIPGVVEPLAPVLPEGLKVPHIGWNRLDLVKPDDPLFKYTREDDYVYYVHSFYASRCAGSTLATSEYGIPVTGVVRRGSVIGMQFHPEKSGDAGLRLLRAFTEL